MEIGELLQHSEYSEYAVLYTLDTNKKQKVWHDGTMRLFKINRKLIVYDPSHLVVYEDFYRQYEQFAADQTLKFDDAWVSIDSFIGAFERNVLGQITGTENTPTAVKRLEKPTSRKHKPTVLAHQRRRRVIGLRRSRDFKSPFKGSPEASKTKTQPRKAPKIQSPSERVGRVEVGQSSSAKGSSAVASITPNGSSTPCQPAITPCQPVITPGSTSPDESVMLPTPSRTSSRNLNLNKPVSAPQVDVYDSESNDEVSDPEDDEKHETQHAQRRLFHRLESNGDENGVVTETWGHHSGTDHCPGVLHYSRDLLSR